MLAAVLATTIRARLDSVTFPVGRALSRAGVTANVLTAVGLAGMLGAAALIGAGRFGAGAGVLIGAALADLFDGAVAKSTASATAWGAFFDSVVDRVGDAALFGAIAWRFRVTEPRIT